MTVNDRARVRRSARGFSTIELLAVVGVMLIVAGISMPPLIAARRALRSVGIIRELVSNLRDARQIAISQRHAVTFQYDDSTKQIRFINHGANAAGVGITGVGVLQDPSYPNTAGSSVVRTYSLVETGIPASQIAYGMPASVPANAKTLADTCTLTALASNKVTLTFQPDGTIIDSTGATRNVALFIYNRAQTDDAAMAISVLGGSGRVKAWRYSTSAQKYVE
jgi:Tfp pilus assembly protein FimT